MLSTNQNIRKDVPSTGYVTSLQSDDGKVGIPISDILARVRRGQIPNIRSILNKMLELNVLWNEEGIIQINSTEVPNSNIFDIMRYFSNPSMRVEPSGTEILYKHLSPYLPKSWFKNKPIIGKRKMSTPYVLTEYPLEESDMENLRRENNKLIKKLKKMQQSDASDDEFSGEEKDPYSISFSTGKSKMEEDITKILRPTQILKMRKQEVEDDIIPPPFNLTPKKGEASSNIGEGVREEIEVVKTPTPKYKASRYVSPENEGNVPTPSTEKSPWKKKGRKKSVGEDIFGKKEGEHTPSTVLRSGRNSVRNKKYNNPEWDTRWK